MKVPCWVDITACTVAVRLREAIAAAGPFYFFVRVLGGRRLLGHTKAVACVLLPQRKQLGHRQVDAKQLPRTTAGSLAPPSAPAEVAAPTLNKKRAEARTFNCTKKRFVSCLAALSSAER